MKLKRFNYLLHRWSGIGLGLLLLMWFTSGIVMMDSLIGFSAAIELALEDYEKRGHPVARDPERTIVGGRLRLWNERLVYQVWHQRGARIKSYLLIDAVQGTVLSPVSPQQARAVAAAVVPDVPVSGIDLLPRGDHYMFWGSSHLEDFPVFRVRFEDDDHTFVYVGQETGRVYATADRVARVATWFGTVPHWLYFMTLYEHRGLWTWLNLILPGAAVLISLSGVVLGTYQLFPRRRRGRWSVSAYHGVSVWHPPWPTSPESYSASWCCRGRSAASSRCSAPPMRHGRDRLKRSGSDRLGTIASC